MKARPHPILVFLLLFVTAYSLGARLEGSMQSWPGTAQRSRNILATIMGEGSRLFAGYFFVKADVYFHSGYYPSIFDRKELFHRGKPGETEEHGDDHDHEEEEKANFLGKPLDVIDQFSRNFYPSEHTHLGEKSAKGHNDLEEVKEILPWIRIATEMDPHKDETYTLAAYWLRTRLGRIKEAEEFLREGWRQNPNSYSILFELGRINEEQKKDDARARNFYEAALRKWNAQQASSAEPDLLGFREIVTHLAVLEDRAGNYEKAIAWWEKLRPIANPQKIDEWIATVKEHQKNAGGQKP
jgi:tetratricopeptide (TPR) repeat protein